jgi:hypothetical protein
MKDALTIRNYTDIISDARDIRLLCDLLVAANTSVDEDTVKYLKESPIKGEQSLTEKTLERIKILSKHLEDITS